MKKILILIMAIQLILCSYFIVYGQSFDDQFNGDVNDGLEKTSSFSVKAKVIDVVTEKIEIDEENQENYLFNEIQAVTLEVLSGEHKGEVVTVENYLGTNEVSDIRVVKGQRVILSLDDFGDGNINVYINSYERDIPLYALILIFLIAILCVGRFQGVKTIVTLSITILIVFFFTVPMILKAYNPILISVVSCIAITVITLFIIAGVNEKSFAAILSTALSVIISGLLAYLVGYFARLTGVEMTEGNMLMHIPQNIAFNFKELLFAGIIIGTLGAAMDMCMSVTSAMHEVKKHNPQISSKELYKSGLNVGKDVMANTLILAYTGSALPTLLVFAAYNTPMMDIMNLDIIATEIVRSIAGSTGVVLSVPITAYIVVLFEKIKNKRLNAQWAKINNNVERKPSVKLMFRALWAWV